VPNRASDELTRRHLLKGASTAAALALAAAGGAELLSDREHVRRIRSFAVKPAGPVRAFHSRPDLRPPTVRTTGTAQELSGDGDGPGFLFLGPGPVSLKGSQQYGPLIVDRDGEPVWFRPVAPGLEVTNFASASYRGQPVLVWWEGKVLGSGYGQGEAVIVDRAYRELTRVRAANGRSMDMHALALTPEGTALFTCYPQSVEVDLSPIGGPRRGEVLESIIQEVDIASGRLRFEWTALSQISLGDSYVRFGVPYDYLHINSVSPLPDGNLLVSGRHTWALYKLDRRSGEVMWRLGGKNSEFRMGRDAQFSWQHDARQSMDGLLTVFDNGTDGPIRTAGQSRGLVLDIDESDRTVAVRSAYKHHRPLLATAMGSVQMLSSGDVVVGWGTASHTSEVAADGTLLLDAALPPGMYSYRGQLFAWRSEPHDRPVVTAAARRDATLIYASWNGATDVADWRVDAGLAADQLHPVGLAKRRGFETVIPLHRHLRFAALTALDSAGRPVRRTDTFRL
jgi:hypothetical protein